MELTPDRSAHLPGNMPLGGVNGARLISHQMVSPCVPLKLAWHLLGQITMYRPHRYCKEKGTKSSVRLMARPVSTYQQPYARDPRVIAEAVWGAPSDAPN